MKNLVSLFLQILLLFSITFSQDIYYETGKNEVKGIPQLSLKFLNNFTKLDQSDTRIDSIIATGSNGYKSKAVFQYQNNRVEEVLLFSFFGLEWELLDKVVIEYDEEGKKIGQNAQTWLSDSAWVDDYRTIYTYNEKNEMTSYVYQNYNNGNWENFWRTFYFYSEKNRESISQDYNENWVNDFRALDYLDESSNLDSSFYYDWKGGQWEKYRKVIRYFNELDEPIYLDLFDYTNSDSWVRIAGWEHFYDTENKLYKTHSYEWTDGNQNLISRLTYHYKHGQLFEVNNEVLENGNWLQAAYDGIVIKVTDDYTIAYLYPKVNIYHSEITDVDATEELANQFELHQNYPNPFNPSTTIKFTVETSSSVPLLSKERDERVRLEVYNTLGQKIRTLVNEILHPGTHEVTFDASDLPSGVYYYRLTNGKYSASKKMLLMK